MGAIEAQLLFSQVMHSRLFPKRNRFTYGVYYLALPLSQLSSLPIAHNRFSWLSFYDRDHGKCDGSNLQDWAKALFEQYNIHTEEGHITLVCMPRVLGYVFNPVSFWLYRDDNNHLLAVLCEVNNTFGERHTYICAHENGQAIGSGDLLRGKKVFHVSPMLKREGHYHFRFNITEKEFGIWIDFINDDEKKQLATSLVGSLQTMNSQSLRRAFWRYPLVTFKVIALIHWQALKLLTKGIKYLTKPKQREERTSGTIQQRHNITKM